jgi:formate-dependent nitrite reductase membrane component NrfD
MINHIHTVINEPHWGILVAIYYFLVAVSSGTILVALLAKYFGNPLPETIFKKAAYIALGALVIAPVVLIGELMQPMRFIYLMNPMNFNPSSPLAWGGVIIAGYGALLLLFMYRHGWIGSKQSQIATQESAAAGETGPCCATIGLFVLALAFAVLPPLELIVVQAKAFWRSELLVVYFFTTSIMAGAAVLSFLLWSENKQADAKLYSNILVGGVALSAIWIVIRSIGLNAGGAEELLALKLWWGNMEFLAGELLLGLAVPFAVLVMAGMRSSSTANKVACLLVLVGVFAMRYVVVFVGNAAILP